MSRNAKSVSEKNTKNEIFAAYQELLSEASSGVSPSFEYKEEQAVVATATGQTVEKITSELSKLKLSFAGAVNELADRLTQEAETLSTIQKAIAIAKRELEETQKIKGTAGLLYRMLEVQKTKEKEWAEEERTHMEETERMRSREEEEYRYEKQLQKKRDADIKEDEREAQEKLHAELADLRKKVATSPTDMEKAVKEAVAIAVTQNHEDAVIKAQFAKQQADAALVLASAKNDSLETTVKMQANEIMQLKKQLDEATRQVKDIAVSMIENMRKDTAPFVPQAEK
ncbi:MAG: hypothetical protein AAB492_05515 [Patescibacteria group bacterium]